MNVQFSYTTDAVVVESLTRTHFHNYFKGSELVVSGQTRSSHEGTIRANITGQGRNGEITMGVTVWNLVSPPDRHLLRHLHLAPTPRNFVRRLWAFLSVKDLLDEEKAAVSHHARANARRKALALALQNHFVTPLTSLVVLQPDQEHCKDYEEDNLDDEQEEESDVTRDTSDGADVGDVAGEGSDVTDNGPGDSDIITGGTDSMPGGGGDVYSRNGSSEEEVLRGPDSEWFDPSLEVDEEKEQQPPLKLEDDDDPVAAAHDQTPDSDNMARSYDLSPRIYSDSGDYPYEDYNALDPLKVSDTTDDTRSCTLPVHHPSTTVWLPLMLLALLYCHLRNSWHPAWVT
uniref:Inter-alpha-trypsin inhibitor heavy chain H4-like n=1 Tax=Hirondellea gigas TaxID=1518452 RepID=A0A6A7G8D0_9CRUS